MQDIKPNGRNKKPVRIDEVKTKFRDDGILRAYNAQYTIIEIGLAFNMSHQNVWKIIVREKSIK